jgi:hypothetical protein
VHIAGTPEEFASAIQRGIDNPDDPFRLRARVEWETWTSKADAVIDRLSAEVEEMRAA